MGAFELLMVKGIPAMLGPAALMHIPHEVPYPMEYDAKDSIGGKYIPTFEFTRTIPYYPTFRPPLHVRVAPPRDYRAELAALDREDAQAKSTH